MQVGLLYAPLALGIYFALNVVGLPDLTLEGSFGIGAAMMTIGMVAELPPPVSLFLAVAAGALAGLVTSLLHVVLRMNVLLAGLLMTNAAFSVVLVMLGTSNVSLVGRPTLFTTVAKVVPANWADVIVAGGLTVLCLAGLSTFLATSYGLSLRAAGMNIQIARGNGVRTETRQIVGLSIANGLAGLSGSLVVQSQGFMDVSVSFGIIVVGIAAMMIGLTVVKSSRVGLSMAGVALGVLIYQVVLALALSAGVNPTYVKAITTIIVIVFVVVRGYAFLAAARPGAEAVRRLRRERAEFLENDRVVKIA